MYKRFLLLVPAVIAVITWAYSSDTAHPEKVPNEELVPVTVRVSPGTEGQISFLDGLGAYQVSEIPASRTDRSYVYELLPEKVDYLKENSVPFEILPVRQNNWNDEDYFSYQEVYDALVLTELLYPDIAVMESLGVSSRDSVTIWGLKISDNPDVQEDEPDAMVDGVIHAREPVTVNICLALIDSLTQGYGRDPDITSLVNETEIWIVPIQNVEGYLYVETGITNPWWRKNKRDNNNNGIFEGVVWETCNGEYPSMPDGVDLNRNFPEGWANAGDPDSCSIVYRGPSALSENETQMERRFVEREHMVATTCLHSYSEYVGYCGRDSAGVLLCHDMANAIGSLGGGTYDCETFYGLGQSYNWMYWDHGVQGYLIETATEFFPSGSDTINNIVENNVNGLLTMLYRVHGSSIRGNVYDSQTLEPLVADVYVSGEEPINFPRSSEEVYGRFTRLVIPGTYSLMVLKEGYETLDITDVVVEEGIPTIVEVPLVNTASGIEGGDQADAPPAVRSFSVSQNYPNPFNPSTNFQFSVPESNGPVHVQVSIYDVRGRLVRKLLDEEKESGIYKIHWDGKATKGITVPSGVYFYQVQAGEHSGTRKMILTK